MTDLSTPSAATLHAAEPGSSRKARAPGFAWPTPPFAGYPPEAEQTQPEACRVVGTNGKALDGRLVLFVPEQRVVTVQVAHARTTLSLHFNQFRSLELTDALEPLNDAADPQLAPPGATPFKISLTGRGTIDGETLGHLHNDLGVFLFLPERDGPAVKRLFVPQEAIVAFEFGSRLGELLVESGAATPEQIQEAARVQRELRQRKLGDILVAQHSVTPDQLLAAIEQQSRMPMVRIGEALVALGLIEARQLDEALEQQKSDRGVPIGELLVRLGRITRQDLQTALARKMGYPLVDVNAFPIEAEALRRLPHPVAERLRALPLLLRDGTLVVAVDDPSKRSVLEELEFASQCKVAPVLARHGDLSAALQTGYARIGVETGGLPGHEPDADAAGKLLENLEREGAESRDQDKPIEQSDNSLVRLIHTMIIEAHAQGVSDIHVETHPGREKLKIRFRKDGQLHPYLELPHTYRAAVIGRIKIMCDLDISERRKPQDGKINFSKFSPGHKLELRVATVPTNNGLEDVVMRLLTSARPVPLDGLGLSPRHLGQLKTAMERPYGLILCVGPTGSGKTTSLHSALSHINVPERKIWTAEDPIEITQPGLRQVQVNAKIDWTFAKALRAFLRADPDVIMVGEVRDAETARTAIEASLTGHLVLTTLHTNSAPETVTRLLDMGMDPFNFADSLLLVMAQRLVRKLCTECREHRPMSEAELEELLDDHLFALRPADPAAARAALQTEWLGRFGREGRLQHYSARGCPACAQTGFRGRHGIHELMPISRELRHLIQTGTRAELLQQTALAEGMRTLRQDGIEKVLQGITTIDEVRSTSNV